MQKNINKIKKIEEEKSKLIDFYEESMKSKDKLMNVVNLSTGSGKSYNFFQGFDKYVTGKKEKNQNKKVLAFYNAPLKSHLEHEDAVSNFQNKDIKIIKILGVGDYRLNGQNPFVFIQKNYDNLKEIIKMFQELLSNNEFNNSQNNKIQEMLIKNTKELVNDLFGKIKNTLKEIEFINDNDENIVIDVVDINNYINEKFKDEKISLFSELSNLFNNFINRINFICFTIINNNKMINNSNIDLTKAYEKIISYFFPLNMIDYYDYIIFQLTTSKTLYPFNYIKENPNKKNSFILENLGLNLFDMLSKEKQPKIDIKSAKEEIIDKNIINKYLPDVFVISDEAADAYKIYDEKLLENGEFAFILPNLLHTVFKIVGNFPKDENTKQLYNFINSAKTSKDDKLLNDYFELKGSSKNRKNGNQKNEENTNKEIKKLRSENPKIEKLIKEFQKYSEYHSYNDLKFSAKFYKVLNEKLKYFNLDKNKLQDIIKLSENNHLALKIDSNLYFELSKEFNTIFIKQDKNIFINNKDQLNKLFIKEINNKSNILEIVQEKDGSTNITFFEYLSVTIAIFNLLLYKNNSKYLFQNYYDENPINDKNKDLSKTNNDIITFVFEEIKKYKTFDLENLNEGLENANRIKIDEKLIYEDDKVIIQLLNAKNNFRNSSSNKQIDLKINISLYKGSPEKLILSPFGKYKGVYKFFMLSATTGFLTDYVLQFDLQYIDKWFKNNSDKGYKLNFIDEMKNSYPLIESINNVRKKEKDAVKINIFNVKELEIKELYFKEYQNFVEKGIEELKKERNFSKYKKMEINWIFFHIYRILNDNNLSFGLIITQTTKYLSKYLYELAQTNTQNHFIFKENNISIEFENEKFKNKNKLIVKLKIKKGEINENIKLIIYKSKINEEYENKTNKKFKDILNTDNEKCIIISDYTNGSTGLNFKQYKNNGNIVKDFDDIVINLDMYYYPFQEKTMKKDIKDVILKMKYIYKNNLTNIFDLNNMNELDNPKDSNNIKYKFFLKYLNSIYLIKKIIQILGRGERTDLNDFINIWINNETFENLIDNYELLENSDDKDIIKLISPNNQELYNKTIEIKKTYLIENEQVKNFIENKQERIIKFFDDKIDTLLLEISNIKNNKNIEHFDITYDAWEKLRDVKTLLKNKEQYKENLLKIKYFDENFVNSLFLEDIFKKSIEENKININDLNKIKYLKDSAQKKIITDRKDSSIRFDQIYESLYKKFLEYEKDKNSQLIISKVITSNLNNLSLPIFSFFQRILYGALLEHLTLEHINNLEKHSDENYIKKIFSKEDIRKYPYLFEKFDIYVETEKTIFAIDCKNWSLYFDKKNGDEKIKDAEKKYNDLKLDINKDFNKNIELIFINTFNDDIDENYKKGDFWNSFSLFLIEFKRNEEPMIHISNHLENEFKKGI